MRVLIACEESQAVCKEFRKRGHEAYSCDVQPCSGGRPEWHIRGDVLKQLDKGWDMMIAFPPCTHLAVSGARWFPEKRKDGRQQQGIDFFMAMINAPIDKIAVENPIGIMSSIYRKPDQIIQPWMFGHGETKATCLWLKNLPPLFHTDKVDLFNNTITHVEGRENRIHKMPPSADRGKLRSVTYIGVGKAMAEQWSDNLLA